MDLPEASQHAKCSAIVNPSGGFVKRKLREETAAAVPVAARRFYNGNARALNTRIETVPPTLVASAWGVVPAEYFLTDGAQVRAVPAGDIA
jgi:hypothetical protein